MRQRKAALGRKYEITMRKLMREALRSTFKAEARAIDPTWELPLMEGEVLKNWAETMTKQAKKAKRKHRKQRKEFLEQRLRQSVSAMAPVEQQEAIEMILGQDKKKQNHQIIQRRLKRARICN